MFAALSWISFTILLSHSPITTNANSADTPVGFAASVTGGQGGEVVKVSTAEQLQQAASSKGKKIIQVTGKLNGGAKGMSIRVESDKSIIGQGSGSILESMGLVMHGVNNVIIQNLDITLKTLVNPSIDANMHCIEINSGILIWIVNATNIWVDHCNLHNVRPKEKESSIYHVNVGIQSGARNMTFSWNRFYDMGRNFLIGAGDDETSDWSITIHHNRFENLVERNPLMRGGNGHVFNNYFKDIGFYGVNAVVGACLRVEKNVFENVASPIIANHAMVKSPGAIENITNVLHNTTSGGSFNSNPAACKAKIPYAYQAEEPEAAKKAVLANAGTQQLGKGGGNASGNTAGNASGSTGASSGTPTAAPAGASDAAAQQPAGSASGPPG